jgi:N-acyl-D-aspartate/D-glutamate deacylase
MPPGRQPPLKQVSASSALTLFVGALCIILFGTARAEQFDLVLHGGRVIDPETGLDAVRDIGIAGNKILSVSATPLSGDRILDVSGLVVAPGFIDVHQHDQDTDGMRLKAFDLSTILDRSTYQNPMAPSTGMRYVIVNGVVLIDQGNLLPNTFPGRALTPRQSSTDRLPGSTTGSN